MAHAITTAHSAKSFTATAREDAIENPPLSREEAVWLQSAVEAGLLTPGSLPCAGAFPSYETVALSAAPRLQWRVRAGFTPASLTPRTVMARHSITVGDFPLYDNPSA